MATIYQGPRGAHLQFGGGGVGGGGMGRIGMGDRGSEINWAVSRLTGDEARGKVALLTEELKQMKLMNTEIKLVKDALRRQQKELRQLETEGDTLQQEVESEKARRLELARMLEQAKKNNPLLNPEEYPLTDADLEDKPLRATDEDEAAAVAAAEEVDAEMEEAAAAGMMGGAPVSGAGDRVMDDLLSLLMSNTAAGAELGLPSAPAPAPSAIFAGAAMPVAMAGGEPVEVRSGQQQQQQQAPPPLLSAASPVLLSHPAAAQPSLIEGALSPHGSAIPQDLFKSAESWTKPAPAPGPALAPAPAPTKTPQLEPEPEPEPQPEPQKEPEPQPQPQPQPQPPPHPSQVANVDDEDGAI